MPITVKLQNDAMHFIAQDETGASVNLDGSPEIGGQNLGMRPMDNLLASLGGCSGIDIQLILGKQRQLVDSLEMQISSVREQHDTYSVFKEINILFKLSGNLDTSKVQKAVELSMQKYCSVAKILEKTATINYQIELNNVPL